MNVNVQQIWFPPSMGVLVLLAGLGVSGCSSADAFQYGESDMEQVAVGDWSGRWSAGTAAPADFTLQIRRPQQPGVHPQCASRQFESEGAGENRPSPRPLCIAASEMHLDGLLTVSDASLSGVALTGALRVEGLQFGAADLRLWSSASELNLIAQWVSGHWESCRAEHANGDLLATCTLETRTK